MAKIVLASIGSWGDLFPFIGAGVALRDRGHDVLLASTPGYATIVGDAGLTFVPLEPTPATDPGPRGMNDADPRAIDHRLRGLIGVRYIWRTWILPHLDSHIDTLSGHAADADVVVGNPLALAAPIAAELAGVSYATLSLFPETIPTISHSPVQPTMTPPGLLGRTANRVAWANTIRILDTMLARGVRRSRQRLGLPRDRKPWSRLFDDPYLVALSPTFVERRADWPDTVEITDFPAWDQPRLSDADDALDEFVRVEPPVLITLGSSTALKPGGLYDSAITAVRHLGRRAVVLTGPCPTPPSGAPGVFVTEFSSLRALAPRCCAVIHHGGVGTAQTVLEAGIPQLVAPGYYGQPHTAARLQQLGVAIVVPMRKATPTAVRTALARLLDTDDYSKNATRLAASADTKTNTGDTARRIEALAVTLQRRAS